MKIITVSGKAQAGKDTTSSMILEELENKGKSVLIFHYADLLKFICEKYFRWDGIKNEAGRQLLQVLGTDRIRKQNNDYFVNFAVEFFGLFREEWDFVLIPDTRFSNEIERLKEAGFDVQHIRIIRPNFDNGLTEEQKQHPSETALDHYTYDIGVLNDKGLEELRATASIIAKELLA